MTNNGYSKNNLNIFEKIFVFNKNIFKFALLNKSKENWSGSSAG